MHHARIQEIFVFGGREKREFFSGPHQRLEKLLRGCFGVGGVFWGGDKKGGGKGKGDGAVTKKEA